MIPVKLTNTVEVLEWAMGCNDCHWAVCGDPAHSLPDCATAARIAENERLRQCVDEMEHMPVPDGNQPDCIGDGFCASHAEETGEANGWNACVNTLRAALDEVKR